MPRKKTEVLQDLLLAQAHVDKQEKLEGIWQQREAEAIARRASLVDGKAHAKQIRDSLLTELDTAT